MHYARFAVIVLGLMLPVGLTRAANNPIDTPPVATTTPPQTVQLTICLGLDFAALKLLDQWEQQHPFRPDQERVLDVCWTLQHADGQRVSNRQSALTDCGFIYLNPLISSGLTPGQWNGTITVGDDRGTLLTGKLEGWNMLLRPNSGNNVRPLVLYVYQPPAPHRHR